MNVTVYAAATPAGSWAGWSIAPEVDAAYWLDAGYRAEAERAARRWEDERGANGAGWPAEEGMGMQGAGWAPEGHRGAGAANREMSGSERAAMRSGIEKQRAGGTPSDRFGDGLKDGERMKSELVREGAGWTLAGRSGNAAGGEAVRLVAWPVPLPLGHALQVAARWPGGRLPGGSLEATLSRLVGDVWAGDARLGLPVPRQPSAHARHVPGAADAGAGRAGARALAARACR
ncbi:hypothetical protein, partial [Paenibacillus sp. GCM10023250]|uniref:hypothetical protein n=1 Tax=Paenibacillus sp. GCM10023250 TaxID=3252648 RepID=UPI003607E107